MKKIVIALSGFLLIIVMAIVYNNKELKYDTSSKILFSNTKERLTDCKECLDVQGIRINYTVEEETKRKNDKLGMSIDFGNGFIQNSNNTIVRDSSLLLVNSSDVLDFDLSIIIPEIERKFSNFSCINPYDINSNCKYRLNLGYDNQYEFDSKLLLTKFEMTGNVNVNIRVSNGFLISSESKNTIREVLIAECLKKITIKMKELLKYNKKK